MVYLATPTGAKVVRSASVFAHDWEALRGVARNNERSLSAELRRAIQRHLVSEAENGPHAMTSRAI